MTKWHSSSIMVSMDKQMDWYFVKLNNLLISTTASGYQDHSTCLASYKTFNNTITQPEVVKPVQLQDQAFLKCQEKYVCSDVKYNAFGLKMCSTCKRVLKNVLYTYIYIYKSDIQTTSS